MVDDHDLVSLGIKNYSVNVILMDVKMLGMGGLEATKHIVNEHLEIKILVVTVYGDESYPTRVLQTGASGYMTKGISVNEMIQEIKTIYAVRRCLSPEVAQQCY